MNFCKKCGKQNTTTGALCEECQGYGETVLLSHNEKDETTLLSKQNQEETTLLSENSDNQNDTVLLSNEGSSFTNDSREEMQSGILFGRYQVESILGKGGMGTVYLVKDHRVKGKLWAIKETLINPDHYQDFVDEAKLLAALEHPNLPKIVDYYPPNENGQTYLVMDYIKGKTLSQLFEESQYSLTYQRVIKYAIQLCNLLDYLHNHKPTPIIYRDLKPSNVMIDEKDNVQLIDFGIARKYKEGKQTDTVQLGTVGFAAPEQFEDKQTDHRTDLFSLGAMIYYLLSGGRYVYSSKQSLQEINQEVPEELNAIVQKLVKTDPNERYQNAQTLKKDLTKLRVTGTLTKGTNNLDEKRENKLKKKLEKKEARKEKANQFKRSFKKWSIISMLLVILGGAAYGYFMYTSIQHDKLHTIEKFEEAIIKKDKTALIGLLTSSDQRLTIGEKEVDSFLEHLNTNPTQLSPLIDGLKEQATLEQEGVVQASDNNKSTFHFKVGEKKYFLIDTYKIEVIPSFITLKANKSNTQILMNGQEIAKTEKDDFTRDFGPFMPGLYHIKAVWNSDFTTLEDERSIALFNVDQQKQEEVSFDLTGQTIKIDSNYPDAKLYINSKDTGLTVKDASPFGPVLTDGSMKMYAEHSFPWGTVRSDEVTISNDDPVSLTIQPMNDQLRESLFITGNDYIQSYLKAYQANDEMEITHLNDSLANKYKQSFQDIRKRYPTRKATLSKIQYDLESLTVHSDLKDVYEVEVKASFVYDLSVTKDGSDAVDSSTEAENQLITFTYAPAKEKWMISNIKNTDSISGVNIKEFAFNQENTATTAAAN